MGEGLSLWSLGKECHCYTIEGTSTQGSVEGCLGRSIAHTGGAEDVSRKSDQMFFFF